MSSSAPPTEQRPPQVAIRVMPCTNLDAYDVWVFRYNWPEGEPAFAEVLTSEGWVRRADEAELAQTTLRIDGLTLHYDKPLDIALRGLIAAERDVTDRIERHVEGSVMRALAGRPAWFPLHETSDGRLLVDITERDAL